MTFRYQFFRPLAYLFVRGPTLNFYRFFGPAICVCVACALYALLPIPLDLIGDKSISGYLLPFFSSLPGFFIAALAAVVAFNGGDLDNEISNVEAKVSANGDTDWVPISLRVFLCHLFAYLTIASFLGFFYCLLGTVLSANIVAVVQSTVPKHAVVILEAFRYIFLAGMTYTAGTIIFCTIQGLYFLAERVHQKLS